MTLTKILEQINYDTVEVRFTEDMGDYASPPMHTTSSGLKDLYVDWYGEAENCPENGTLIYGLEFNDNGRVFWIDNSTGYPMSFEEMMHAVEKFFNLVGVDERQ